VYKKVRNPNQKVQKVPKLTIGETNAQRPSQVFAKRLQETRKDRGFSQTALAQRLTEAGQPMSKAALLRIESGERGLLLDEALALAQVLHVAPAHLLSPEDDEQIALTPSFSVDGAGLRNWLLFGAPMLAMTEEGQRASARIKLAFNIEDYARAIVDARDGRDKAGLESATRALEAVILEHQKEIVRVNAEDERGANG
jgi:transcriptional regulator with XRE-family HTH domain